MKWFVLLAAGRRVEVSSVAALCFAGLLTQVGTVLHEVGLLRFDCKDR